MDVILLERIEKLGQMGDVVSVKPGFARNYLLPKGKALRATDANKARFEIEKTHLEAQNLELKSEAEAVAAKMDGLSVVLVRQAGEAGQLYGSVNGRDIAEALANDGYSVTRQQVRLDRPIKLLGLHEVGLTLHPEVSVIVTANVARSAEEAETQASTGKAVLSQAEEEARLVEEEAAAAEVAADEAVAEQAEIMFEDGAAPDAEDEDGDAGDTVAPADTDNASKEAEEAEKAE